VATQKVTIADSDTAQKIADFMGVIEEDDDVSEVFTNADMAY